MDKLVKVLLEGEHPVLFEPRIDDYNEIRERLVKLKFVFIKFLDTMGTTELGLTVDDNLTDLISSDFDNKKGMISVVGTCKLNYHLVRCYANIDLENKKGKARLEILCS